MLAQRRVILAGTTSRLAAAVAREVLAGGDELISLTPELPPWGGAHVSCDIEVAGSVETALSEIGAGWDALVYVGGTDAALLHPGEAALLTSGHNCVAAGGAMVCVWALSRRPVLGRLEERAARTWRGQQIRTNHVFLRFGDPSGRVWPHLLDDGSDGRAQDIAVVTTFLAGPGSAVINGQLIVVQGTLQPDMRHTGLVRSESGLRDRRSKCTEFAEVQELPAVAHAI